VIEFKLRLRAITLFTVGWGISEVLGADVVHARKPTPNGYSYYVPGSTVKGILRTEASRIAAFYGFSSCGEIEPGRIRSAHSRIGEACDVCKLFGYPEESGLEGLSAVYVSDFRVVGSPKPIVMTRVSLEDETLTAKEGALYTMEQLPPGTEFEGTIKLREGNLLPLLLLAIASLRTGRFGRRSMADARIEDNGALDSIIDPRWSNLLRELRSWLWEGETR